MNYNELELRRETLFKDAVLNAADAAGMQLITEAHQKSAQALAQARQSCEALDHDLVAAAMQRDTDRDYSAAAQETRRQLLHHRAQLVDDMFAEIEARLAAFAGGRDYAAWLAGRVKARARDLAPGGSPTVYLRAEDMKHEAAVKKALPGCTVQPAAYIRLGGARLSDGKRVFDETLDARLDAERERFTLESRLTV